MATRRVGAISIKNRIILPIMGVGQKGGLFLTENGDDSSAIELEIEEINWRDTDSEVDAHLPSHIVSVEYRDATRAIECGDFKTFADANIMRGGDGRKGLYKSAKRRWGGWGVQTLGNGMWVIRASVEKRLWASSENGNRTRGASCGRFRKSAHRVGFRRGNRTFRTLLGNSL